MDMFTYTSYRSFVKDYIRKSRGTVKPYTLQSLAKKMGITGPGLQMILSGKRDLSNANLHKLAKILKLSEIEHSYFETLVNYEQAKESQTKTFYRTQLKIKKNTKLKYAHITNNDILSEWYMPVLLVYLIDEAYDTETQEIKIDYTKIENKLGLNEVVAKAYIKKLVDIGIIEFRRQGQVHVIFEKINSYFPQRQYLHKVLKVMPKLLDAHFDKRTGFFETTAFSMDPTKLEDFRSEYKTLVSKYINETDSVNQRVIFQVLNCFVPVI